MSSTYQNETGPASAGALPTGTDVLVLGTVGATTRVVRLSSGEYEAHYIGGNWPHRIFVEQDLTVVGAEQAGRPAAG